MAVRADHLSVAGLCGAAVADWSNVVDLKDHGLKERLADVALNQRSLAGSFGSSLLLLHPSRSLPKQRARTDRRETVSSTKAVGHLDHAVTGLGGGVGVATMISDVSRAMPEGRRHNPETWKCLFMSACGHAVRFEIGLDNRPFPVGFQSSRLTKREMADLITTVQEYGDRHQIAWSEPNPYEVAQ